METGNNKTQKKDTSTGSIDLEKLLEERERLDELIHKKFTRTITIMFTDLKGSTSIAESEGDVISRFLIKKHNDILFPIIRENRGVLVKTMGDGTLSYFENAQDAVRAAVQIQTGIDNYNNTRKSKTALFVRIGLNTGIGIVEKNDIFGDVVNVASRFQSLAGPGEIYISESTYNSLNNKDEFYCRFIKMSRLKEKKGIHKIYKVFWDEKEIERDKSYRPSDTEEGDSQNTITLEKFYKEHLVLSAEETAALHNAENLERSNELIELYLFCEECKIESIANMYRNLISKLEASGKIETNLNGENALWFFEETITIGRVPDADFPITNKAISRVPINIGIKNGEGTLEIDGVGTEKVKPVEIEKPHAREPVKTNTEYPLGKNGKIIFSVCFPFEYTVYKDRFLIVKILNPEECIKKHFNFTLRDVWKDFDHESEKIVVIGK